MKILFIYPQILEHGDIPIALTTLSAVLRLAGHSVEVFDCSRYVPEADTESMKINVGMFKPAPPPPVPIPQRRDVKQLNKDLVSATNAFNADIIGITATSGTYTLGLECSKIIKKHFPGKIIIFGGIHPTICPDEVIKEPSVDIICVGEGEDVLLELCETLQKKKPINKIKNLWVKDKENPDIIYKNPLRDLKDLNTLPVQDFSDFNEYDFYRHLDGKTYKMLNTEISRGCVFKCSYC